MTDGIPLQVNGHSVPVAADGDTPLIYALRNDLGLKGVRAGCGIGECGACTVLADGRAIRSCSTPLSAVAAQAIVTPEGLGGPDDPHPVQQAFLDEQAAQCGYCINGMIMTVSGMIDAGERPDAIEGALTEHLCRCGTHTRILRAVRRAAGGRPHEAVAPAPAPQAGCTCGPWDGLPGLIRKAPAVEDWLRLSSAGTVEALSGRVELGQGIRTSFAQLVAAQIGISPDRVAVLSPTTGQTPDTGITAGSMSTELGGTALATAAVAFRRLVLGRCADHLGVAADVLSIDDAGVAAPEGTLSWADLAAMGPITGTIAADDRPHWHGGSLGQSVGRDDLPAKLTGGPAYVHDLVLDGMLHARALLPPSYDARLDAVDLAAAEALPGVRAVVRDDRLVLAIAEREEQAVRAIARLAQSARWTDPGIAIEGDIAETLRALPAEQAVARADEGAATALEAGTTRRAASYTRPYQGHAPMAPSCAVAVDDGRLTVWSSTQGVYPLRAELAAMLDVDEADVEVRHADGPGCYGHTLADDAAGYAAVAARAVPGVPVRFQFSSEDEFVWDPFGPAMLVDLAASLDADGVITAWHHRSRTDLHTTRPSGDGDRLVVSWLRGNSRPRPWTGPHEQGMRDAVPLYDIAAVDAATDFIQGPLRSSALRSLGSHLNTFAIESFMDELAEAAGQDPVEFRLIHLTDDRAKAVLRAAAAAAGWRPRVGPSGNGQGVALARYKGSKAYVAQVVEAAIDQETAEIAVSRIVMAADAGSVVNTDGLRNQLEGGALQGLSRALYEEVRFDRGGIRSRGWPTYPVLRFGAVPAVEVVLLPQPGLPPLGAGESSTPPLAAALGNAIDDAVGLRLRDLPFTPARTRRRLETMDAAESSRLRLT